MKTWLTKNTQVALRSFDYEIHKSAWEDVAKAANEHNDPGHFTTFIGYEFTTSTNIEGGNLHRNVIFNSSKAPIRPWTRIDSINPGIYGRGKINYEIRASILFQYLIIQMGQMVRCLKWKPFILILLIANMLKKNAK